MSKAPKTPSKKIQLKNVRLSFPSLFQPAVFNGQEGKYEATFLIPKNTKLGKRLKKQLDEAIDAAIKESGLKIPRANLCLKDGDEKDYDGYEDNWSIKAANKKRPTVFDRDKTPLTEHDDKIYAGCIVNAVIDLWVQDNEYGKRINANLYGVQFVDDDEPFGAGPVDVTDEFDDLDDDDDDDDVDLGLDD